MERYVELRRPGGRLRGMLHLPDRRAFRPPWPGVVLYHGFTGGRAEARFLFVHFSRLLARHGIASARFDFLGSGESDGEFRDMTLSGEIADARAILERFGRVRGVDPERLFLLGLSAGGTIAGYVAGERGREVRGLVLWAPAGEISERIREREEYLQAAAAAAAAAGGPSPDPADYGGLRVGPRYVSDAQEVRVLESSARYPGPVLVVYGTSDPVVPPAVARRYGELFGARARLAPIQGAGHVFEGAAWREELYGRSLEFIRENARP
jgi:pimeloyl-ACP methyl ester carboxylesterase